MMDAVLQKAIERVNRGLKEAEEVQVLPQPRGLGEIKKARMVEREFEKGAPSTGYPDLDNLVKGFIPGHLYTVTGETNVGKTSIACNFAVKVAFQMKKVLYIALEPENSVIEYIASVYHDKRFDELTDEDLDLDALSIDVLGKEDVSTTQQLVDVIESFDRYDLVIVDHVGYFIQSQNNWLQEQSNMVKLFAGLAKKNQCALLLIAHLRKRGKNDKKNYTPSISDISGSGAFGQDSTDVMIVTRRMATDDPGEVRYADSGRLYVVKTKSGPNGFMDLCFSERKANIVPAVVPPIDWGTSGVRM